MKDILHEIMVIDLGPVLGSRSDFTPDEWDSILKLRAFFTLRTKENHRIAQAALTKLDKNV
jgi:hypothetical protein